MAYDIILYGCAVVSLIGAVGSLIYAHRTLQHAKRAQAAVREAREALKPRTYVSLDDIQRHVEQEARLKAVENKGYRGYRD